MMKRIAALTALVITLLAVPAAAAMASTNGPGSGYAKPRPALLVCARVHRFHRGYVTRHHKRIPVRIRIACPFLPARQLPRGCSFTVSRDGSLFVNKGAAITNGTALMCCAR